MSTTYPIKDLNTLERFKSYYCLKGNPRNYALIIVGLNTALRIGDILMLQWKDVYNYEKKCFRKHLCLTEQKTKKESMIALNAAVISALSAMKQYSTDTEKYFPGGYVFTSSRNPSQPISRYQAYRIVREAALHSGAEEAAHISCHSLRKTFGYFAWKQGVPPAMLMTIYNHSSYQITKRYLCIEQEDKDDVFLTIQL